MVIAFIQQTIANRIGSEKPKEINLDFSLINDERMNENTFYTILEDLEEEMDIELVDYAWKFETVKHLVDFINKHT